MSDPGRIFIGTSANGEDAPAEMTYEYSLRKNSSAPVEITWMKQTHMSHLRGADGRRTDGPLHSQALDGLFPKYVALKVEQSILIVI